MTCDQLSVHSWLRYLRFNTENYDPGVPTSEFDIKEEEGKEDIKTIVRETNEKETSAVVIKETNERSTSGGALKETKYCGKELKISKINEEETWIFVEKPIARRISDANSKMSSESENLKRLSVLSGSYEDIWSCSTEFREETELKHGHVCRISFEFDEMVQDLCIKPVILAKFDFSIPTNIIQWKSELLFDYSSEDEENQEYVSLEKINEEKGQTCYNQPRPFPIENTVEIRHNNESVRRGGFRSQTVHEFAYGNIEQQLESVVETPIDIRGVTKLWYDSSTKKLTKNHMLRICHDQMTLICDRNEEEVIINKLNQTSYKPMSKKEIVITKTTEDVCKTYKLQFDSTKDMNLAVVDLERYYGGDRPSYLLYQTNGEEKSQIRYKLLKLLGKRSSKDLLEKKGIIRNEPIFGNTLKHLYAMDKQEVPEFVTRIVQFIELPKNIKSIGLYRASGNLATIQKIRFHIDKNNLKILDEFKNDIDVLTGSLKLFFRELKEPLIPHKTYEELCRYIDTDINTKAEEHIQQIVGKMDKPHRKTLLTLLEHLLKVESHSEENRMDAYNISIVWGPTLIWPPDNCHENILLSHTNANKVVELLLNVYKKTFEVPRKNESSPKISYKEESKNEAASENLLLNKNALILQLNENLTHNLRKTSSKDTLIKSTDNLTKLEHPKTPDKEMKYNLELLCLNSKEKIPEFLTKVIPLIEKGINSELLYKRSGNNDKLEKIKKKVAKSRSNLGSMEKYNVHDLAWALKNFFSDLTEPLIPKETLERLVLATDERLEVTKLRNTKRELTNANIPYRETLDYLLKHLVNVSRHEETNKMSKHNIATEWAPYLFRSYLENHQITIGSCIHVLETLLQIYDDKTIINVISERDLKHVYQNSENRLGRSPDKSEDSLMAQVLGRSPDKTYPPALKRKPRITKNDSSLYRVSRFITNTLSLYDNVQVPYVESVKDEATILDANSLKNSSGKNMEHRTKL